MSPVIEIEVTAFTSVWLLLSGSKSFKALGAISVDEIMKNNNSRKTISVIDAMLDSRAIVLLRFSAMTFGLSRFV